MSITCPEYMCGHVVAVADGGLVAAASELRRHLSGVHYRYGDELIRSMSHAEGADAIVITLDYPALGRGRI
ncbi:hypothetical protein G1H11_17660 [Phytoactinopolyspora alkaliphila]|uniref:Uncharacterized protein n=1 Tax=Phytoactinopolyspora alkaliphila TaxID=1783498 RepID=A0A6N9YQK5_9ACTN|nr:hypothetical protein [Phytoactinopolyspora alkaliphila]NED97128.1 hypothetical protein [Phytoactinopolyspora alkaliphila]